MKKCKKSSSFFSIDSTLISDSIKQFPALAKCAAQLLQDDIVTSIYFKLMDRQAKANNVGSDLIRVHTFCHSHYMFQEAFL